MKKKKTIMIFLLAFILICTVLIVVNREHESKNVSQIIYKDIKIVAENNSLDNTGVVQGLDVKTNKLLWSTTVFKGTSTSSGDENVQLVFVKTMKIDKGRLLVFNKGNQVREIDPNTGKILNLASGT